MDKYNLIILILIIILALLFLWINIFQNNSITEGFTVAEYNDDKKVFGNLLVNTTDITSLPLPFKKQYKLTGIYITNSNSDSGSYSFKVNNGLVSYNDSTELNIGKYYDISSLNIKAKTFEITPVSGSSITGIKIYGLNDNNIMTKSNYDAIEPISGFTIDDTDSTLIKFNSDYEYLINYMEIPASRTDQNINVEYKNQFTTNDTGFDKLSSGITDLVNKFHSGSTKIYFTKPILASQIKLIGHSGLTDVNDVKLYGKMAGENDVKTFKLQSNIDNEENEDVVLDGQKCPPINDIINRQKQINELCNSISEKDKIRNQQTNYEKTKKYIGKLKQQEAQIQALRTKLDTLMKDNENTSLSFQEKVASLQDMINAVNTDNPFNKVDINYTDTPVITSNPTTISTNITST
jgi:hypothetical protein